MLDSLKHLLARVLHAALHRRFPLLVVDVVLWLD